MDDSEVWKKWVSQADSVSGTWAPLPKPPKIVEIVPASIKKPQPWHYTFDVPEEKWFAHGFNPAEAGWERGLAGFGTRQTPGTVVRTQWDTSDIWIRKQFELEDIPANLHLRVHHDEDAQIYINGVLATNLFGYTSDYQTFSLTEPARRALRKGSNVIAVHCHQTQGGQYIDAGLVEVIPQE